MAVLTLRERKLTTWSTIKDTKENTTSITQPFSADEVVPSLKGKTS